MSITELKKVIHHLKEAGGTVNLVECQDHSLVDRISQQLGLEFPESLRSFYRTYEYLQVGIYEFEWIRNLMDLVSRIRALQTGIPSNYLPILKDGMGGYYYIVCSKKGETRPLDFGAVFYKPDRSSNIIELCDSDFINFVISKINEELEELD